ncbi:MAG: N-acetyl-gamma-glutamyl-phosphate reductase [Anaerolineales bacterium]|nr:N-acetyl-gamma-glutamyl-phosphate reductase [Anaerolineales bacterium]MCB9128691.1 N-acetyl-gamma-glutamyl-phosphate reductase [Ardenticatenales bacterium]
MIRTAIIGATGYTGFELLGLLSRHPHVTLDYVTSRADAGRPIGALYPTRQPMVLSDVEALPLDEIDLLFVALPHAAAAPFVARGLTAGCRVIDLSADFRLRDAASYRQWYGADHPAPALLAEAVYGLTEWARPALGDCRLVANPGCYPTSILLALAPLLAAGRLADATIIADSKSGTSGAGRAPKVATLFAEVSDNLTPYAIGHAHRHSAEVEQEMAALGGDAAPRGLLFSPHLLPVTRGILSTLYLPWRDALSEAALRDLYANHYTKEPFIWLLPAGETATLAHSVGTNRCTISLHPVPERGHLIIVSTLDNLLKGAAGQAVQNMNVMFGWDERAGLTA